MVIKSQGYNIEPHNTLAGLESQFRVSDGSKIALGYSPLALLILFVISFVVMSLSIIFGFHRLKGNMVAGGCKSLVISAACHVGDEVSMDRLSRSISRESQRLSNRTRTITKPL